MPYVLKNNIYGRKVLCKNKIRGKINRFTSLTRERQTGLEPATPSLGS